MTRSEVPGTIRGMRLVLIFVATLFLGLCSDSVYAAEEAAEASIVALDQGEKAPRAGMLIGQEDLVTWRLEIERLRYELDAVKDLHLDQTRVRKELCLERIDAREEAQRVREELWRERAAELGAQVKEARAAARAAAKRGWWEHPALWASVGVIATTAVVVGVQR